MLDISYYLLACYGAITPNTSVKDKENMSQRDMLSDKDKEMSNIIKNFNALKAWKEALENAPANEIDHEARKRSLEKIRRMENDLTNQFNGI
jgi:hypothetical protein